ncbi:hypothetical protein [Ornithinimicrobium avium]|uniref:Uncharacterized protein n=1 Tax=Ornithinimicrobium avium TaxID=2283195 RepID=A0A345NLX9_9MICO|nr:hypothetical protein [Ornithinimicrobium avium]AXH96037.1 hypothetical protein DV701_07765 [Ornithinimicrobium avium]
MARTFLSTEQSQQAVGRFAWAAAWAGLVLGQLHALARHNTVDGQGDLQQPLTRWWSDPARRVLRPLLDWADPDTVYLTYGKVWLPVFLAFTLCAVVVYRRRRPTGWERLAWRVLLGGYALACVAVLIDYWTQWTGYNRFAQASFFVLTVPSLALVLLGGTVLGSTLLVRRYRPLLPALLLALQVPLALGILSFTSMGSAALPTMFAFAVLGRRVALALPVDGRRRSGSRQPDPQLLGQ